jgi:hypothetical protein
MIYRVFSVYLGGRLKLEEVGAMKKATCCGFMLLAIMISTLGWGATLYVTETGECGGSTPCYSNIQAAVDAAYDGDEIRVAGGTYSDTASKDIGGRTYTQVVAITKSLTLTGGYSSTDWTTSDPTANPTIIDAQEMGRGISIVGDGSQTATVAGFTITNGNYTGLGNPQGVGGSVCQRTGSDCGGGFFAYRVKLILRNCAITNNVASMEKDYSDGGGAYLWDLKEGSLIEDTTFIGNKTLAVGGDGGGLSLFDVGTVSILRSLFQENQASEAGGGLSIFQPDGQILIEDTDFIDNTAPQGGALEAKLTFEGDALRLNRVKMENNEARSYGAAVSLVKQGTVDSRVEMINTMVTGNNVTAPETYASVINVEGGSGGDFNLDLSHLTLADNGAPAALRLTTYYNQPLEATVINTLIQNATHAFVGRGINGEVSIEETNTLTWNVTNLHTIESGTPTFNSINPITGDPKLDATYHLQMGSAAIDAGVDAGVTTDIDGDPRPVGPAPDIGADEFSQINPYEGTLGTIMTISGSGFGPKKGKVLLGSEGLKIKILSWSDESIQAQLSKPLPSGPYDVIIQPKEKGVGQIVIPSGFTVKAAEIHSIEQGEGTAYDEIILTGKFFGTKKGKVYLEYEENGNTVRKSGKVTNWWMDSVTNESEIIFIVPKMLPEVCDVVVDPYSTLEEVEEEDGFEVKAPEIIGVNPNPSPVGQEIAISGNYFGSKKKKVYLGYINVKNGKYKKKSCSIVSWGDEEIVFVVPNLAVGSYDVIVTNSVGSARYSQEFNIN